MIPLYSISVCGGFEKIASQEIQNRLEGSGELRIVGQKPGRILCRYSGSPRRLLSLRSAEHVFLVIRTFREVTRSRHVLAEVRKSLQKVDFRSFFEICRKVGLRLRRRITFRVTSHMSGLRNFRRIDAQRVVEQALLTYGWRLTDEQPALDVWVEIHGDDAYVSIRLSPMEMAKRDYKSAHIPASLKPTVAYCLVHLSHPQPNDVFLDPMCGAGTILIERADFGRYRYLLGGDAASEAIDAAQTNIGRKHRPRQLFLWDARSLPLDRWSVDKIVCNLPFGEQIAHVAEIRTLYRGFLEECRRVVRPTGRMVLLTTQGAVLDDLCGQSRFGFKVAQRFRVNLLGQRPSVYLCLPR